MDIFSYNGSTSLTERGRIFYSFFLRFLKENKCFYKYQRAFYSCKNEERADRIRRFINLCNTWDSVVLSASFIWATTIEGHKFWERINDKFKILNYQLTVKPKVVEIETNIITKKQSIKMSLNDILGTLLMALSIIIGCVVLFFISWKVGILACCFICYRLGGYLCSKNRFYI